MKSLNRRDIRVSAWLGIFAVSTILIAGCSKKDEKPKYRTLTGRVCSINKETRIVEMWWFEPTRKEEVKIAGILAPEAEILINGIVANLDDVKVDDQVKVTGKQVKEEGKKKLIAVKVEIERPDAEAPASRSTTAPSK